MKTPTLPQRRQRPTPACGERRRRKHCQRPLKFERLSGRLLLATDITFSNVTAAPGDNQVTIDVLVSGGEDISAISMPTIIGSGPGSSETIKIVGLDLTGSIWGGLSVSSSSTPNPGPGGAIVDIALTEASQNAVADGKLVTLILDIPANRAIETVSVTTRDFGTVVLVATNSASQPLELNVTDGSIDVVAESLPALAISNQTGLTTLRENGTANGSFQVALTKQPTSNVVVDIQSSDATEAIGSPSQLTFTPQDWNSPQTVNVLGQDDILDDGDVSGTITVSVNDALSDDAFDSVVDQSLAFTTLDDEPTIEAEVTLSIAPASMLEAGGTSTVTVTLSVVSSLDVTVALAFSGTATNVTDYARSATQVVIPAGNTTGTVTPTAVQDTLDETNETIVVDITSVTNGTESGIQQVSATIIDDDAPPNVTLSVAPASMAEATGTSTVTATLSAVSGLDVTVALTFTGTATNVTDYTRSGTQIVIPAGNTTGTVTLTAVQDTLDETDETIVVVISGVTNGTESGTQQAIATITDDDAPPSVTLSVSPASMVEASGTSTVTATLSAVSSLDVTVALAFSGTATLTDDYTRSGTQIVITAGNTTGTVTLTAEQDALNEIDETIVVDITSVTNGTESGTQQTTTTIDDDDVGGDVQVALPLSVSDLFGNPLPDNRVELGQSFRLNAFVQDVRPNPMGVFAAYLDVAYDSPQRFSVISSEQQRLILPHDTTGGIYELTFQGVSTGPIALGATLAAATHNLQLALENHPQIGTGNVRVINASILDSTAPSGTNTFAFDISFVNDLAEMDLPTLAVDASLLTGTSGQPAASVQVIADADPDRSAPAWFRRAFMGGPFYNFFRGLNEDGDKDPVTGQILDPNVLSEVGFGIPSSNPVSGTEGNRVLLWSVDLHADTTGPIHFTGNPADSFPTSALLVFGRNDAVPVDQATYGNVSVEIVEAGAVPIQLLAGETRVTNENGTIFVRHNGDVLFQRARTETTELHFLGSNGDDILAVGDLGMHDGQAIDLTFDGQDGTDTLRLFETSSTLDFTTLAEGVLQSVEIIDVAGSGSTMRLSLAVVQHISPNRPLRLQSGVGETIEFGTGWNVESPRIADGQFIHVLSQAEATLHVINDRAWQNPLDSLDTNRDGSVSPLDSLVGINTLNTLGPGELPTPTSVVEPEQFLYFDTNGDRSISPLDVLLVINFLNDPRINSEAEATPLAFPNAATDNSTFFSPGDPAATLLLPASTARDSRDYARLAEPLVQPSGSANRREAMLPESVAAHWFDAGLNTARMSELSESLAIDDLLSNIIDDLVHSLHS